MFPEQHDEFWETGTSNGRQLQWRLLEIPPHSVYPLHTHPTIEVYLVVRGVLHESRMAGPPLLTPDQFADDAVVAETLDFASQGDDFALVFERGRVIEGGFAVNEIGSVHQVFTEAEGCVLLVLGAGANKIIEPERWPTTPHSFRAATVVGSAGWQVQER